MKNQALFSSRDKSKKLKCRLLQFFLALSLLRVNPVRRAHTGFYVVLLITIFYADQITPRNEP